MNTPWGASQSSTKIIPGLVFYSTASHGGVHVSPTKNVKIPEYMRNADGWYEEDCEIAIPFLIFKDEILKKGTDHHKRVVNDGSVELTMKQYYPDLYARFKGDSPKEWDRSQCLQKHCTCHDDSAPAYVCSHCGCKPKQ